MKEITEKVKEFFGTSWAIDNRSSIYVLTVIITILGLFSYFTMPKESFPEVVIPTVLVSTVYPGTSPQDMENLVTRPIEKELKSLSDVKNITSSSLQDYSSIGVEFNTDVEITEAKQRVKDAVDKARPKLPNNLPSEPDVMDINLSEFPIMYIQLSGNYDLDRLKKYAEAAQDKIETLKEITRVDIVGALEREIQVNVDMYKLQIASLTLGDVERAIAGENLTISGGNMTTYGMKRSIRVEGQFKDPSEIANIALISSSGAMVYIKNIATVKDTFKEQESFSRLNGKNVITLNVIKKSGENLLNASDQINDILAEMKKADFPPDLDVVLTGEQSRYTRNTLEELNFTMIVGFLLVTLVLMFFMGFTNAFFVALAVPLSMFIAYMIMPALDYSMNMMTMFSFIFALGIIVDDAIVVIENTHRIHKFQPDIVKAAKYGAGEVFLPILSGTLTTLAPFFPLIFWPGIVGQFMIYLPVTLIISLFASLFVAYFINPVFAVSFMKHEYHTMKDSERRRRLRRSSILFISLGLIFHLMRWPGMGNFMILVFILNLLFHLYVKKAIKWFQSTGWPAALNLYEKQLRFFLKGRMPYWLLGGIMALFFLAFIIAGMANLKVRFFPDNEPNNIYVMISLPVGTDQLVTDSITAVVEQKVMDVLGKDNPDVESVITNVALGASDPEGFDRSVASEKGMITVNFVEHKFRQGQKTETYLEKIREVVKGIPAANIVVQKNSMGPPTGKPINIEISGEDLPVLIANAEAFQNYLDSAQIQGIQELKSNFDKYKPEVIIKIDRERANREGISTGQIAMEIRNAVYGAEVSKFKDGEDEYPIQLRYDEKTRKNVDALINLKIIFMDMVSGKLRQIPLSSVASIQYQDSYGGINRKNLKRVITISSEVLSGYTANEVVAKIKTLAERFPKSMGIEIKLTGEQEEQEETSNFLFLAMIISLGLIFFILITQFNSIGKAVIILSEVVFSIIGVILGYAIFGMDISILMTGLGIVALGGIVVRNGILIVEFTDVLKSQGLKTRQALIQAGKTRITPVILTATATMMGLVPLALGLNINFVTLFTELNPHIHYGGDNVMFWGPLSWAIIFGLSFATFLTLIFVPAMYLMYEAFKVRLSRRKSNKTYRRIQKGESPFMWN
ncbi:MAG TPA: efflux RND transporter permease subunit [Bacteroidales bacterium]|nr:efflux RND transporter permease subunit [Bacteroidales bacterium]HSA44604.1 efflux RND transporter permease subunit [Bacteroidales bacterium]